MVWCYEFTKEVLYFPIHLNVIFSLGGQFDFEKDYIDGSLVDEIFNEIVKSNYQYYLLDFSNIKMSDSRVFEVFRQILVNHQNMKNIIFSNLTERVYGILHNADCYGCVVPDKTEVALSTAEGIKFFERLNSNNDYLGYVFESKKALIGEFIRNKLEERVVFLESSGVYSNMYIDIKKFFYQPNIYNLVVYELCQMIVSKFGQKFDALVCASTNGAALATIIGKILCKDVLYLMNLGPHLTIRDNELIDKISPKKKYVFIYDFVCLGTEFKMAKTIVNLKDAEISGAVGVAKYRYLDSEQKNNFYYIVDVNSDCNLGYKVAVEESELINNGEGTSDAGH